MSGSRCPVLEVERDAEKVMDSPRPRRHVGRTEEMICGPEATFRWICALP